MGPPRPSRASGGTVPLIAGIYGCLLAAITALDPRDLRHAGRSHDGWAPGALGGAAGDHLPSLLVLGTGIVTAIVGGGGIGALAVLALDHYTDDLSC